MMKYYSQRLAFIGAGNFATQLSLELFEKGYGIVQVWSRTDLSAARLAEKVNAAFTSDLNKITTGADIYFIAVNDDAISNIVKKISLPGKILVHSSGSVAMDILAPSGANIGVFYPLQTFTRNKKASFSEIPVCIEAADEATYQRLFKIASDISDTVLNINSEQRAMLHLAAVFVNNFTNHLFSVAENILKEHNLDFNILIPLILETVNKIKKNSPSQIQTGPAMRGDNKIIEKHMSLLKGNEAEIYKLLTENIMKAAKR